MHQWSSTYWYGLLISLIFSTTSDLICSEGSSELWYTCWRRQDIFGEGRIQEHLSFVAVSIHIHTYLGSSWLYPKLQSQSKQLRNTEIFSQPLVASSVKVATNPRRRVIKKYLIILNQNQNQVSVICIYGMLSSLQIILMHVLNISRVN